MSWSIAKAFSDYSVSEKSLEVEVEIEEVEEMDSMEREDLLASFKNEFIDLSWLNDRICNNNGSIIEPKKYIDLTEDNSDEGCLQFLDGKINKEMKYIDLLAWTGLRDFIRNGFSDVELVVESRKKKHFNKFKLACGAIVAVQTNHILVYCNSIFNSRLTREQFEYLFRNTKGFIVGETIGLTQLSLEKCWMFFQEVCSGNIFKRAKFKKDDNFLQRNNGVTRSLSANKYDKYKGGGGNKWHTKV